MSAEQAVGLIRSGDTVATGGFVGIGFAEELACALEQRFLSHGEPNHLTLFYAAGQGDGDERGLNHLGYAGLVSRVIGGHWGLVPRLQRLALDNQIEAYNLPQGVISHLYRDIAAHKPGTLTRVGLHTFVDPLHEGGRINARTTQDIVERVTLSGEDFLFYHAHPLHVALLRGTSADEDGNISFEHEALRLESLAMAMAVKNSGGTVMVQVERLVERHSLRCRDVLIPGVLVDVVVPARGENHWQTFATVYQPGYSGEVRVPARSLPPMPMGLRKVIARRAAQELRAGQVVNLGIGIPEGVANVANEENMLGDITLTAEPGVIGGVPAGGLDFGASMNADAIVDQPYQFDFYDGGGLDIAFLGMAQVDVSGNVNVSRFSGRLAGAGGFINISQNTRQVVFLGTFMASGRIDIQDGLLAIYDHESEPKFVSQVEQVTFSGSYAIERQQRVLYITERCVFTLTSSGLELIEIAPGVDLERDILACMAFRPKVAASLRLMDPRLFMPGILRLGEHGGAD